ncbi:phage tail sheath family protein [Urechidicola croceus]|uniref:Phage tail protein n=1 Tax=Urechidicola croceus TaxID=1850246 RepID=A0A1D8P819_9FLAO|nr:phage tail sheath C-terminal domain-containing protein [Urechidicola croceus]AOW20713.1 phage tail protein [Urechidicola croceus]
MTQKLMTPGVYIREESAFPGSVVEVATAIPAFIGYTDIASRNGKSLNNEPTRITSFAEYRLLFGGAFNAKFSLDDTAKDVYEHKITINDQEKYINYKTDNDAFLFKAISLFYQNGGGTCYIVSVGTYRDKEKVEVKKEELETGLDTLLKEQEPTMVVIPDAVKLKDKCYNVYVNVLAHCAKMQSRVAILDIYDGYKDRIRDKTDIIKKFRGNIGTENLNYAAAYYPWLHTSIVQNSDITYENLVPSDDDAAVATDTVDSAAAGEPATTPTDDVSTTAGEPATSEGNAFQTFLASILKEPKAQKVIEDFYKPEEPVTTEDATTVDDTAGDPAATTDTATTDDSATTDEVAVVLTPEQIAQKLAVKKRNFHLGLIATSPTYSNLLNEITAVMNLLPPSSAMAGIYTQVDNSRGVWKAPANISINNVVKPASNITHDDQEDLNVDAISGKSINAIRTFPGIGTLVWGGRTLDGNSLDWKYINVRRTIIMLEQSIKLALRAYVFEPNDSNTWVTVKSMIINFLTDKWKQGALAGSSPEDAFDVQLGLGSTMTSLDILEGRMLVSIKLAIVRPAEFIVVTFQQQMQKS